MKKYIVVASALLVLVSMKVSAQWQPNPYTSGDIFFNGGRVGIGTNLPGYHLQVSANPSGGMGLFSGNPNLTVVTRIDNTYDDSAMADTSPFTPLLVNCRASGGGDTAKCGLQFSTANNPTIGTRLLTALRNNATGASSFYLQNFDGAVWQTRMVVDPAGNVGFGTNPPGSPLQVSANPSGGGGLFSGNPNLTVVTRIDNTYDDSGTADTSPFTPLLVDCRASGGGDTAKCGLQFSTAGNLTIGTRLLTALRNNGTGASSFYVQNFDGAAWQTRMVVDPAGNVGIGTTNPGQRLSVTGTVESTGLTIHGSATIDGTLTAGTVIGAVYQDVAEWVPATTKMDAGTVVVLNPSACDEVMPSSHAYDTTVAGVVSAHPGLILGRQGDDKAQIATTGRVKVHVDATKRAVKVGDLLVTSDKPGMAMVSEPVDLGGVRIHRPGTLVGKALEPLPSGEGDVLVLLSLQ